MSKCTQFGQLKWDSYHGDCDPHHSAACKWKKDESNFANRYNLVIKRRDNLNIFSVQTVLVKKDPSGKA